jgi:hypothetical protein
LTRVRPARALFIALFTCLALLVPLVVTATAQAAPPPVQIYYLPIPETQVFAAMTGIYPGGAANQCNSVAPDVASPIITYVSISVISAGTIIF